MSEPLAKAIRYRELAAECVRLSEIATDERVCGGYRNLAASYLALARAELRRIDQTAAREQFQR